MLDALALGRGDLDRMAHLRDDAQGLAAVLADAHTFVVGVSGEHVAMDGAGLRNCRSLEREPDRTLLIGRAHGVVCVAVMCDDPSDFRSLRDVGADLTDDDAAVATAAVALHQWHRAHTHCPRCGAPTRNAKAGWERHCTVDGTSHFPRTDPAVIVVITDDSDRLLLGRQSVWGPQRFSLIAGYVEPGETAEQAVAREVLEEVGIAVRDIEFLASQPWPFPASLMLCYRARARSTDFRVDGVEIEQAMWVSRDNLQALITRGELRLPSRVSIARRAIENWYGSALAD